MNATSNTDPPSEACRAFAAALAAVVDDAADTRLAARTVAHAAACAPCAHRLTSARAYRARMRRAGAAERAPSTLHERVGRILQAVRGSPTR